MQPRKKASSRPKHKAANRPRLTVGPPTFVLQPMVSRKIQFQIGTANLLNQVVTASQLGKMCVPFMALTATTSSFISNQFRVRKISLWAPPPAIGSITQISLKYSDTNSVQGNTGPSHFSGDSSMEPDRPAKCAIIPTPGSSYQQFFAVTASPNFFVLTCPLGSILQVSFDHYVDDSGTITTGPTLIGASPGVVYHAIATIGSAIVTPHSSLNSIAAWVRSCRNWMILPFGAPSGQTHVIRDKNLSSFPLDFLMEFAPFNLGSLSFLFVREGTFFGSFRDPAYMLVCNINMHRTNHSSLASPWRVPGKSSYFSKGA